MWGVSFDRYKQGGGGGVSPVRSRTKLEKLSSTPATTSHCIADRLVERLLEMSG